MIKDQIQYRSQSLLNLARGNFSIKSLMNLNQNFLCSLFDILMSKTNYDRLKKIFKRIEKSSVNPIAAFDHKYMK